MKAKSATYTSLLSRKLLKKEPLLKGSGLFCVVDRILNRDSSQGVTAICRVLIR